MLLVDFSGEIKNIQEHTNLVFYLPRQALPARCKAGRVFTQKKPS